MQRTEHQVPGAVPHGTGAARSRPWLGLAGATREAGATGVVVSVLGVLAGLVGIEHGIGEILQGDVPVETVVLESWPGVAAFQPLDGEPALSLLPTMQVAGWASVAVGTAVVLWSALYVRRPRGGLVLVGLSALLFLVGGGFGPPLLGTVLGLATLGVGRGRAPGRLTARLARHWRGALATAVVGYLALMPGTVLLQALAGVDDASLVAAITVAAFAALGLAIVSARAHDRLVASPPAGPARLWPRR
ncbi:hypothetical protein [Georgenia sp. SUBG003]|uniref:hypothetical protein n=1 Tax=Georgenia sp. SUBG003 TaxID=1497974 RepID=UPI000693F439